MELSNMVQQISGCAVREMFDEAEKIKDPLSFTVGEPDFVTPRAIIDEACRYWQQGLTHYTPNRGIPELRQAIAENHKDLLKVNPDTDVMVSCGATEALQMALFTIVNPGDEVIVITPAWPNYFGQVEMCGGIVHPLPVREENDFLPTPDDLLAAITPRTKAIILNSPSNPTGAVMDYKTCEEIAGVLREHPVYIIADEIYSRLVYDAPYTSIVSLPGLLEKTIYISGFSKMFAMTGWRLGYAIAKPEIIANMTKLHEYGASCLPAPSQMAAAYALRHCDEAVEHMRLQYGRRRDLLCNLVNDTPGISIRPPRGAFYGFINVKPLMKASGMDSRALCMDILRQTGVVTVPGSGFGEAGEGYIRMTYAASETKIREGICRIRRYISEKRLFD